MIMLILLQTYTLGLEKTFELNYSASNSGKGKEIMIFSDNLVIPSHKLFCK